MTGHLFEVLQGLAAHGFAGVFVVALLEKLIPIVPAMLLYGLIGASAAETSTPIATLVLATAIGSSAGSAAWYVAIRQTATRYLPAMHNRLGTRMPAWLSTMSFAIGTVRGAALAQVFPGVRFGAALFAADGQTKFMRFAIGTFIGTLVWSTVFLGAGQFLGSALSLM